jgi:NaMN:DMB phosphoribosyltransferase
MLAVAALIHALAGAAGLERILVGTTRWVIDDPAADVAGLADEIWPDLPVAGVNLDFSASRHAALRAYERGLVKEGVGAGAAAMVALLRGSDLCTLHAAIDATYDRLLEPSRTLE